MKKRFQKLMTICSTGVVAGSMLAGPVMAADGNQAGANLNDAGAGTTYTEANGHAVGNRIQFVKTLTMDSEAHVPNIQFKYTLDTPESHERDETNIDATVKNYGDDDASSTKEYTSARVAVKENGKVVYTELYSGGDTTKVTGQPLFVENRTSPAKSSYEGNKTIKAKNTNGTDSATNVVGGTTGVVTFFSGADNAYYEGQATKGNTRDDADPSETTGTQIGEQDYNQDKETATKTGMYETTAGGNGMKVNGGSEGQSQSSTDDTSLDKSKDYINGAGVNGQDLNDENTRNGAVATGKKYAYANVELDFSGVSFNEPGIYRWYITETPSSDDYVKHGITDDNDNTRILDVYVVDKNGETGSTNEGKLEIAGYVMHNEFDTELDDDNGVTGTVDYTVENGVFKSNTPNNAGDDLDALNQTKPDGFANDYETENLRLKKVVKGNQASRDEYFRFEVKIENALPGCVYDVNYGPTAAGAGMIGGTDIKASAGTEDRHNFFSATLPAYGGQTAATQTNNNTNNTIAVPINGADEGIGADGSAIGTDTTGVNNQERNAGTTGITHSNPTRLVADENGVVTAVIWLQHNQEIQISGLPKNSSYSIKEDGKEMDLEGYVTTSTFNKDWTQGTTNQHWDCDTTGVTQMGVVNNVPAYEIKDTAITADTGFVVENKKEGIIPTGIIFAIIPGIAAVAAGGSGAAVVRAKRKREDNEFELDE